MQAFYHTRAPRPPREETHRAGVGRKTTAGRGVTVAVMRLHLAPFVLAALAFVAPAQAEPASVELPIVEATLENGLAVLVHEDHRTPTVTVDIWYDVGSKDDPPGRSGFAHLFEHVMLQGSRHVPEDAYFRFLERAGATDRNATTGPDRTNYFETVPSNELELVMWLESDRMAFLLDHLDDATFKNQRAVVKNERRQTYEDRPYGMGWVLLNEALFPDGHPYHRATIGDAGDLDRASLEEARDFFRTFYRPNNATLVVSGDVKADVALASARKWFGPIAPRAVPRRARPAPVVLPGETRLEVAAGVKLPKLYVGWTAPGRFEEGEAELDVLAGVLANGVSSRLEKKLIRELQVAESVEAYTDMEAYGGRFIVEIVGRAGHDADELLRLVDGELARVRADLTSDEVERARAPHLARMLFSLERSLKRADRLAEYRQIAHDPRFMPKDLARYRAVTAESVKEAAARWLPKDRRVVELIAPTEGAKVSGELRRSSTTPAGGAK
jgi:zinc protease